MSSDKTAFREWIFTLESSHSFAGELWLARIGRI
ncbi:hypothetical protein FB001_14237 [Ensifer sp. SEMIA 135]|nr:hypothetical protein FB001_14237 [Ensifer sp. SEMIA 135]